MADSERNWLERRTYPELDPQVERALREAGLHFADDAVAEAHLARAAALAPEHEAVQIAHYRYYLYKHRFDEAVAYAQTCVASAAERLAVPVDPLAVDQVCFQSALGTQNEDLARFWLFACQALAYVYMRAGQSERGLKLLEHVVAVDHANLSKSAELRDVIVHAGEDDDEDDDEDEQA